MTRIAKLLAEQQPLEAHLWVNDVHTIEAALVEMMEDDPELTLSGAVTQMAIEDGADPKRLWRVLESYWSEGPAVPLGESVARRLKHAGKRVRHSARKVKNRYDRSKNTRRGRAVRRVAKSAKRLARSGAGRAVGAAALSVIGL